MSIKALFFDMDGLLVDSERVTFEMWVDILAAQGHELTLDRYLTFIGQTEEAISKRIAELYPGFDPFTMLYPQWESGYAKLTQEGGVRLKEGALEVLDYAEANGLICSLVSSNTQHWIHAILQSDGVLHRFHPILHGGCVGPGRGKPQPDLFLLAARELGLDPSECLVLEDSNSGILAAHRAGMPVICVKDLKPPEPEQAQLCEMIADSLLEVIPWLEANRG